MKKLFALLAMLSVGAMAASGQATSMNISNVNHMILPPRPYNMGAAARVEAGAVPITVTNGQSVAQGTIQVVGSRWYWATEAGVTTNAPTQASGDSADCGIVWRYMSIDKPRRLFYVANTTTNVVTLGIGAAAVAGKGICLPAFASDLWWTDPKTVPQCAVYAIGGSAAAAVRIYDD